MIRIGKTKNAKVSSKNHFYLDTTMKLNKPFFRHWTVFMLLAATLVLVGCNTVRGVGKDIEKAGEVIQRGADKTS
jgi:predicted small secreted protein